MLDTPTNNFATWNVLTPVDVTLSEGNLKSTNGSGYDIITATIPMQSGKWYWEILIQASTGYDSIGILDPNACGMIDEFLGARNCGSYGYNGWSGAKKANDGLNIAYGDSYASAGNVMGVAYDGDNGTITFYKNGVSQGQAFSGIDTTKFYTAGYSDYDNGTGGAVVANFGQDSSFAGNKTTGSANANDGTYGDFYYTPPSGFLALCTKNLPDPAVIPSEHFNTVLYVGNKPSTQSITGVGFQPDFLWIKDRVSANWHQLFDILRDSTKSLNSNTTSAEANESDQVQSLDSDGFSLGTSDSINGARNFVAWNWKANGAGVSNTSGDITSTVSANADAGFSIVSYTGNGSNSQRIGHGLSKAPEMILVKPRNYTDHWSTYNESLGNTKFMYLDGTDSAWTGNSRWSNTSPTSTVFTNGVSSPATGGGYSYNYIAYCFHSVDGYSKVGSYTGNGSTDGTFVYTGFRPAYVMTKGVDGGTYHNWSIRDNTRSTYNVVDDFVHANSSEAEGTADGLSMDFNSNGFKLRGSDPGQGTSGEEYIYLAFAETPFKYANAR
jgi:hypothetical protein